MTETGWPLIPREVLPAPVPAAKTRPAPRPEPPDGGRQLSIFGAETTEPSPADLAGLLLGPGRLGRMGGTARVSVPVDAAWRVHVLVAELVSRGLVVSWVPLDQAQDQSQDHDDVRDGASVIAEAVGEPERKVPDDDFPPDDVFPPDDFDLPEDFEPIRPIERFDSSESSEQSGWSERSERSDSSEQVDSSEQSDSSESFQSSERFERFEPSERSDSSESFQSSGRSVPSEPFEALEVAGVAESGLPIMVNAPGETDTPVDSAQTEGAEKSDEPDTALSSRPHFEVRTAYSSRLNALARAWPGAAAQLFLSGPRLRLWVAAAGEPFPGGYALGLNPAADPEMIDATLVRAGLSGQLSDDGRHYLIKGRRRLTRLAELVGERPAAAPKDLWPGGAPA